MISIRNVFKKHKKPNSSQTFECHCMCVCVCVRVHVFALTELSATAQPEKTVN